MVPQATSLNHGSDTARRRISRNHQRCTRRKSGRGAVVSIPEFGGHPPAAGYPALDRVQGSGVVYLFLDVSSLETAGRSFGAVPAFFWGASL